jgi:chromate transporter
VIAIVVDALIRLSRKALRTPPVRVIALGALLALAVLRVPFPFVIAAAGLLGALGVVRIGGDPPRTAIAPEPRGESPGLRRSLKVLALCLASWLTPVIACAMLLGTRNVFTQLGVFFSKMAVVTFGGAYAALGYVAQDAVTRYAWVTPTQMVDGLGLAESTPGPLILVMQFVGFLAAYQAAGNSFPAAAGIAGALMTVWVTFVPSFMWILVGAPHVERLRGNPVLANALGAITAAVVGVIANLAAWFALHVLFARQQEFRIPGFSALQLPEMASLQAAPAALTALALLLLLALRQPLPRTLALCVALGLAVRLWP